MALFGMRRTLQRAAPAAPAVPNGRRLYVIGDVHGCVSLLARLLRAIEADHDARGGAKAEIIFLGDLIDRGEDSARLLYALTRHSLGRRCRVVCGNHEATLTDVLAGDHDALDLWLAHGGAATMKSFGIADVDIDPDDSSRMIALTRESIPAAVQQWLAKLPVSLHIGDYFLVHAGVLPGVPLRRQMARDLLWIREPFLSSDADHGAMVVHGHSICENGVEIRSNRIGIDTGGYRTGCLSALAIEGKKRWIIHT